MSANPCAAVDRVLSFLSDLQIFLQHTSTSISPSFHLAQLNPHRYTPGGSGYAPRSRRQRPTARSLAWRKQYPRLHNGPGPKPQEGPPHVLSQSGGIAGKHADHVVVPSMLVPQLVDCFAPTEECVSDYSEDEEDRGASSVEFIMDDNASESPDNPYQECGVGGPDDTAQQDLQSLPPTSSCSDEEQVHPSMTPPQSPSPYRDHSVGSYSSGQRMVRRPHPMRAISPTSDDYHPERICPSLYERIPDFYDDRGVEQSLRQHVYSPRMVSMLGGYHCYDDLGNAPNNNTHGPDEFCDHSDGYGFNDEGYDYEDGGGYGYLDSGGYNCGDYSVYDDGGGN